MAAMIAGVQYARRRKLHHAKNHEFLRSSPSSSRIYSDENMEGTAREAKQRLDEKFRAQREMENKRENTKFMEGRKRSGLRKFSWTKLRWKPSEVEDCAVCLESLKDGERLVHLPCEHRFHFSCLKPWLDKNSQCPCCRATIKI
ncbi:hypothetical protein Lal_00010962 [Lupinus albus]|nr:hypothetical protein Lal_00010962 [Lupinus albus]